MNLKASIIILFGILFVACKQEKPLSEFMVANWQTSYLKIEMPTYKKSDSLFVFEDTFSDSTAKIAKSSYFIDGTFIAWYEDKKNTKTTPTKGLWNATKDSLFIKYLYNNKTVKISYKINRSKDGFTGKSIYDWDEDGKFDDTLLMKAKQIQPIKTPPITKN